MPYCTTPELPDFDIEFEEDYMDEILDEDDLTVASSDIDWID